MVIKQNRDLVGKKMQEFCDLRPALEILLREERVGARPDQRPASHYQDEETQTIPVEKKHNRANIKGGEIP